MVANEDASRAAAPQALPVVAAVSVALVWSTLSGDLLWPLMRPWEAIRSVAYLRSALTVAVDLVVMIGLASLAARRSPLSILALAGLRRPRLIHLWWGLGVFVPVVALCLAFTPPADGLSAKDFVWPGLVGPLGEELFYRGLAIGVLIRVCRWPFPAAALWPAVFFAIVHLWQGRDAMETLGVVAVTSAGGLLLGWLFVRWGFDLWPAVIAHAGMNCVWTVFDLGETAVGGVLGNAERLLSVALAIGLTLWLAPRKPSAA